MRSGPKTLKYSAEFKEFKIEELLEETVPDYFKNESIEQIVKIDIRSFIDDNRHKINKAEVEKFKYRDYCYIHS